MATAVFGAGSPNVNSALGKLDNLQHHIDIGDFAAARAKAFDINTFVLAKFRDATHPLPGSDADLVAFVNKVFCYAGVNASISDPGNAWVVGPTDPTTTLVTEDGQSGTQIPTGTFSEPTIVTVSEIPDTFPANGAGPLHTKLDQYPGFYSFTHSSANDGPLLKPVVVAICPSASVPASVRARLRLGHDASTGFEITPPADASFLNCANATASRSKLRDLLQSVAELVLPKRLNAGAYFFIGGVGGTAGEFSPFAPVDEELRGAGGVGGTAGEFEGRPKGPRSAATQTLADPCLAIEANVLTQVAPACRPSIRITTALGTVLQSVPVSWQIGLGGGTVAAESGGACASFAASAGTTTNSSGIAGVCWALGATPGLNSVVATPSAGGDAPVGVTFVPATITFNATALRITPTATASNVTVPYDGLQHAGSGTCSHGLVPALSYAPGGTSAPVNAGSYTVTVTCGDGLVLYNTVTATATLTITASPTVATVTCPATVGFTGSAVTPCTGAVTGLGLSASLTPTYTNNVVGTATASVSYAGGGNYLPSSASTTFRVLYTQSGCFSAPIYSSLPDSKSAQKKGSNLPVKCTLLTASGAPVLTATGQLVIQDRGINGTSAPVVVLTLDNIFKAGNNGVYSYGLDTSPAGFVSGHYYEATANWNDGSKTVGYFFIK